MNSLFGEDVDKFAAEALGAPSNWEICYSGSVAQILDDERDVINKLADDDGYIPLDVQEDDVISAVQTSMKMIPLPPGYRIIAVRAPEGGGEPIYGMVDLSSKGFK